MWGATAWRSPDMSAQTHPLPVAAGQPQPSPLLVFETLSAYQRTWALKGAIELDLFTAIAEGNRTAETIALRCQASVRGVRMLCDYLTVLGFLAKTGDGYALTPDSAAFLDRRSPQYVGGAAGFLLYPTMFERWREVAAAVRKGGTVSEESALAPDHPLWVEFAKSMAGIQNMPAELLARLLHVENAPRLKVLDVAAGHGLFGIAIARHNPHAEIVAVDWANVLTVAREHAEQAGVAESWRALPGSAFDVEYGTGYDLVLVTNLLHHFDAQTNERLLKKIRTSLAPHGRVAILEFVPNEDRVSPEMAALFPLTMLLGTPSGDAYTFAEHQKMLRNAGFSRAELNDLPPTFSRVVIGYV